MEEKTSETVICKTEKDEVLQESSNIKSEKNGIQSEPKESEPSVKVEVKSENGEVVKSSNKVLKRKITEDGVIIERVLSEGEASSGFETVSSIDSKIDIDELDLSSSIEDDFNIIVKVKNELAFQNNNRPIRRNSYHESRSKNSSWKYSRSDTLSDEYASRRQNGFNKSKESKFQRRNNVDKNYNYTRRDKESSERKNFDHSRQRGYNNDRSSYRDHSRRQRRSRERDSEGRSRRSRSNERSGRYKRSRSSERVRNRSPKYKGSRTESKSSRNFDRSSTSSSSERSSPPRKKRRESFSKSSSSSIWKRLDSRRSSSKTRKEECSDKKNSKMSPDSPHRKKERTPFLVELERKLKEVERSKSVKKEPVEPTATASANEMLLTPTFPLLANQGCNPPLPLTFVPNLPRFVFPVPFPTAPAVNINNLPLMLGPTGLPEHVLPTGDQIPRDVDGRPIPVGPNGYYLPLDPTGRIFPHIISPENQAVPIHMTEDGVLRLPNSEPVPYGPEHQLPVNIDGSVIPIGPDSKPLIPCPDLPNKPPVNILPRIKVERGEQAAEPTPPPPPPPLTRTPPKQTEPEVKLLGTVERRTMETQTDNQHKLQSPVIDLNLLELIQNPSEQINKTEVLNKYKKKAQEKSEDDLKCLEIEKNLGTNPSKGGVRRSIPMKLCQKKTSKDEQGSSGSDMVLDSGDSSSPSVKSLGGWNKGPIEEIVINSDEEDDEKDILKIICDTKVSKVLNSETKFEDYITDKVQRAIKLLSESKPTPPAIGRFIISDFDLVPVVLNLPNESPLLRDRFQLSFLTPNIPINKQPITVKNSEVNFKFLPLKKNSQREEKPDVKQKNSNQKTLQVFTFDFAVQCDFTSETIKNLTSKVSRLETEVTRLKRVNSNLFEDYRKVQNVRIKKSEELKKALTEIQEKNNEIQALKLSLNASK